MDSTAHPTDTATKPMDEIAAIRLRHSVRSYTDAPLTPQVRRRLLDEIGRCNRESGLHIQLVENEPRAFASRWAKYGKFSGVNNYLIIAGQKSDRLDETAGYYGERLVLLLQMLGLNTCWVGLTYSKVPGTFALAPGEKVVCCISLGYGTTQGPSHRTKTRQQVSNATEASPQWFLRGVDAALLAPTAVNQQKFFFRLLPDGRVRAERSFSLVGYTRVDLGIAKYHFEVGAGADSFRWAD